MRRSSDSLVMVCPEVSISADQKIYIGEQHRRSRGDTMEVVRLNKKLWTEATVKPLDFTPGPAVICGCGGGCCYGRW
jgi:hypothetical protein